MFLALTVFVGAVTGCFLVPRWGLLGFAISAVVTFAVLFGLNLTDLYEGFDWAGTMEFFANSVVSYFGYEAQITYRAMGLPMFALGAASVIGLRARR